jgi:integrase
VAAQLAAGEPLGGFALGVRDRARTFLLPAKLYGRGAELALLDRCLTLAQDEVQLAAFLEAMRTRYPQHYALVATLAYTGLRFCHASALRWEDWDELTGVLRVVRKHFRGAIGPVSRKKQAPKEYPVEPELAEILRAHRMRLPKTHANGLAERWMFPSTEGTLRTPNSLDRAWAKCLKHAKITKRFTVHGLRYTFTDLVRRANVDAVVPPGTDRPCDGGDAAALLDRRPG